MTESFRSLWVILGPTLFECAVDSFANKLLIVQRQAETLLNRHQVSEDPTGAQQSFLLRGGHFIGVRWEQGDWQAEWAFQSGDELVLKCEGREQQRIALQFSAANQSAETSERRAA
jgi:hypothetical protein